MENEIRYYLKSIKQAMQPLTEDEQHDEDMNSTCPPEDQVPIRKIFRPTYLVTACRLPTGAIELAVNNSNLSDKIDYILEAYDEDMCLKNNSEIKIENILIV